MKYIRQFLIILFISFLGEVLHALIPLPVPAGIYGFVLLFVSLLTGILKLDQVKDTGAFLIEVMPLMFIPSAVGLMVSWVNFKDKILFYLIITLLSTVLVFGVSGLVTQALMKGGKKHA